MLLNFSPGKSEALPIWRGKFSKSSLKSLNDVANCVSVAVPGGFFNLRFVDKYKHVGTFTDAGPDVSSEIAMKSIVIKKETQRMRRRILSNKLIPQSRRCNFAQSYI